MSNPSRKPLILSIALIFGLVAILVLLTFGNLNYARNNPGGNDFLVHWMGTRNLIVEGVSPYSDQTAIDIQTYAYGRPARQGEHELRFAYPLYSVIFFLPFALVKDFVIARAMWMTLLEVSLIVIAFLGIRLTNWRPNPFVLAMYLLFSLLSYHALRPVINGNAVVLVTLFITGGLVAIRYKADELGGVLFAFATIKPHLALLFVLFVIIWSIRKRRLKILIWLFSTLLLLVLSTMLLIPDWLLQNFLEILRYPQYNPPLNLATALGDLLPAFGNRVGWAIAVIAALVLLLEWGFAFRGQIKSFFFTAVITLLASQWIGIPTDPGNFVILYPAIGLILEAWSRRWKSGGGYFNTLLLLALSFLPWIIFLQTLESGAQPQQSPVMFLPLPVMLWFLLYWSRWWILQSDEQFPLEYFEDEDLSFP